MKLNLYKTLKIAAWILLLVGLIFLSNHFLGWGKNFAFPFPDNYLLGTALTILGGILFLINFFFWSKMTRRAAQLRDSKWRFHWVVIASYQGVADPTFLKTEEACRILNNSWGLKDETALLELIGGYEKGEINTAFDAARILWLAELAVVAKWINEQDLISLSQKACSRIRAAYSNWETFSNDVVDGRGRWYVEIAGKFQVPDDQKQKAISSQEYSKSFWESTLWG